MSLSGFNLRRKFIGGVTRTLERVLRVESQGDDEVVVDKKKIEVFDDEGRLMVLPPTPEELLEMELEIELKEKDEFVRRRLLVIQRCLVVMPAHIKGAIRESPVGIKIRELTSELRLEQIPSAMLEALNNLDLLG